MDGSFRIWNWFWVGGWPSLSPSMIAAGVAGCLAILAFLTNPQRRVNQALAFCLVLVGFWQASIALAPVRPVLFIQLAVFLGGCAICASCLLREAILTPWRSVGGCLWRARYGLLPIVPYFFVFSRWFILSSGPGPESRYGPVLGITDLTSFLWVLYLVFHSVHLLRSGQVKGMARHELHAYAILMGFCEVAYLVRLVTRVGHSATAVWVSPVLFICGLVYFTTLIVRRDILDFRDVRKTILSLGVRGIGYFSIAFLVITLAQRFGAMSSGGRAISSVTLTGLLLGLLAVDRRFRHFFNRRVTSKSFLEAQALTNGLVAQATDAGELHARFMEILQCWSDGSPEIFLSEAVFSVSWPAGPIPDSLLLLAAQPGGVTPEILDRQGARQKEAFAYLDDNRVGAMIAVRSESGGMLLAVFKTRISERPFVSRELREAQELLRMMQFGLDLVGMRQQLRGSDRLNFYAQYAPQFAHELRNGLYLQSTLLRAIAEGRGEEVRPSDAKAGLARMEQVDRLCSHFFNVGALYKRSVEVCNLQEILTSIVGLARWQLADRAEVRIDLRYEAPAEFCCLLSPDLLSMALLNLLKNAIEAIEQEGGVRILEISASQRLDKAHVLVQDRGPGLPADRRRDPFTPGISHKHGGMGLGLAITRDCVEAMGGTIGVRSSGVAGACFEITLACAERLDGTPATDQASVQPWRSFLT